jgi:hypothetical protein
MSAYGERITRVEVEVIALKDSFDAHKQETAKQFSDINDKLDDLLALRNKGAGIVWLVSGLIGAGVIGGLMQLFQHMFGGR